MRLAWTPIRDRIEIASQGGGAERIQREHEKGKMTARERLAILFDPDALPIEVGALAGDVRHTINKLDSSARKNRIHRPENNAVVENTAIG